MKPPHRKRMLKQVGVARLLLETDGLALTMSSGSPPSSLLEAVQDEIEVGEDVGGKARSERKRLTAEAVEFLSP